MIKKIIAIFMSIVVFSNSVLADIGSFVETTSLKSSAGSWSSPSTGIKYHYGGSYKFAFTGRKNIQPWVSFQVPSRSVSCNGISLKGGFVGLLGLNEIKDQIKDAGASIAWGAMIALQYAVPALFQVFNEIRAWAQTIQKMLQNACNITTMMMMSNDKFRKGVGGVNSFLAKNPVGEWIGDNLGGLEKYRKKIDKYVDCSGLSSAPPQGNPEGMSPAAQCESKITDKVDNQEKDKIQAATRTSSAGAFANVLRPIKKSPQKLFVSTLSKLLDGKADLGGATVGSDAERKNIANSIKVMRVFFGDFVIDKQSYLDNVAKKTVSGDGITEGSYGLDKEKIKAALENQTQGKKEKPAKLAIVYIPATIPTAATAATALINGISKDNNKGMCEEGYCYMLDSTIYYSDFMNEDKKRDISIGIINNPINTKDNVTKLEWKGVLKESLSSVRTLVRQKSGITPVSKTFYEGSTDTVKSNLTTHNAPLLVPNINKFISLIAKIEKKAKKETATSIYLKRLLAEQNAQFVAEQMIDSLFGKVQDLGAVGADIATVAAFMEKLEKKKTEIKKELAKIDNKRSNFKEFNDVFLKIERDMQDEKVRKF